MIRQGYVIEGLNRLTGRWEQITPLLSRGVADETMTAYGGRAGLYKSAYRRLRLQRVDGIQLALDFGGDGGTKKKN